MIGNLIRRTGKNIIFHLYWKIATKLNVKILTM